MLSLLCLCVDLSFKNKVISIPRLWCSWCHHMSINAAKSGLGVRGCEQLWLVICFSPCHLFYLVHAIWDSTLKVQYWLTSYPGCVGGEKHFSPPTQLVRLTSSEHLLSIKTSIALINHITHAYLEFSPAVEDDGAHYYYSKLEYYLTWSSRSWPFKLFTAPRFHLNAKNKQARKKSGEALK